MGTLLMKNIENTMFEGDRKIDSQKASPMQIKKRKYKHQDE